MVMTEKSHASISLERRMQQETARRMARNLLDARLEVIRAGLRSASPEERARKFKKSRYDLPAQRLGKFYEGFPVTFECVLPLPVEVIARTLPDSDAVKYICGYYRWREYVLNHEDSRNSLDNRTVLIGSHKFREGQTVRSLKKQPGRAADILPDPRNFITGSTEPMTSSDQPVWWEQIS